MPPRYMRGVRSIDRGQVWRFGLGSGFGFMWRMCLVEVRIQVLLPGIGFAACWHGGQFLLQGLAEALGMEFKGFVRV